MTTMTNPKSEETMEQFFRRIFRQLNWRDLNRMEAYLHSITGDETVKAIYTEGLLFATISDLKEERLNDTPT